MKLYHVSEESGLQVFIPRPSPQYYPDIIGDVVFAVNETMLHNYLLPRECPRVTYYAKTDSAYNDIKKFIGKSDKKYIIIIEPGWLEILKKTVLYLYEFDQGNFEILDEGAGYYISYKPEKPINIIKVDDLSGEINNRNAELRTTDGLRQLTELVKNSTLQFSIIRLRNAKS